MKNYATNLTLKDSLDSTNKTTESSELERLPKAILAKIKLIEKTFR